MKGISDWDKSQAQLIAELQELRQEVHRLGGETLMPQESLASIPLSAHENRVRNILNLAPLPLMIHTQNGEIIQINKAWTDLTGYHHSDIPTIADWARQAHPDCSQEVQTAIAELYDLQEQIICTAEYTITTKTGQHRTWQFTCATLGTLADGRRVAISMATDITDRKQTEALLQQTNLELETRVAERTAQLRALTDRLQQELSERQQTEQLLQQQAQLLELAHDTILTRDLNGRITFWNRGAERMYGISKSEAIGQMYDQILASQFPQPRAEIEAELLSVGYWEGEITHTPPHGTPLIVASRWVLQYNEFQEPLQVLEINNNITRRQQAEADLRESEFRFRQLAENIREIFWSADLKRQELLYINPAYETMWGRSCESLYHNPYDWLDAIHPEDRPRVEQGMSQKYLNGEYDQEYRILRPDGSLRWIHSRAFPIRDQAGKLVKVAGLATDITDRKTAERALQASQARLAGLVEIAPDGIISVDAHQRITLFNQGAERIFGYDAAQVLGQPLDLLMPRDNECNHRFFVEYFSKTSGQTSSRGDRTEIIALRSDGTEFPAEASISKLEIDGEQIFTAILRDISDRKRTEAALSQLAAIVEDSEDAILSKTLEGIVVSWNASAQRLFGYSPAEAIGQSIFSLIVPPDRHQEETTLLQKIAEGESVQQFETVRMRKNDTPIHVALTISPVKDGQGKIIGISTITRDISDRHQIERMKNEFISIVSHEIRTPLTSIRGAIGLLASGIYQNKPDRVQRMLEIALTDSDRLVRLVNDILDLERLESGRLELVKNRCDAAKAIAQAVEGVQAIADKEGVRFSLPPVTATVWASPDALQQVLTNLLSNAIKFSPPQSIITLTVQPQWQGVLFAVRDSGRGIPPDKLEMIFNPFQQVDASDSRQKGGTGLGLTICQRIIHQHGGRLWVESTLGQGSTFYFTLPDPPS
ncbi:PAS domain-containing sensor histidine kinase [Laspinema olomoucense]|uniref:PAS domain-containing sensor histidine kinase n=1 Tax=Laspinema olomoucense TaxID=3231600 RepID=UPI0021BAF9EC|nr:PAS domain S-box protein [Laspinema sp. D3d]MCT7972047.1 PAS domain S-box protein [Laspinema sp. D3d]